MRTKQDILEDIYDKLLDLVIMLDEEAFTDSDIDALYGDINAMVETVSEMIYVDREMT